MNLKEHIDAISDEFQSTFSLINDSTLANLLYEKELGTVEELIKKHIGDSKISFHRTFQLSQEEDGYDIWLIKIEDT